MFVAGKKVTCFSDEEEQRVGLTSIVPFSLPKKRMADGAIYESAGPGKEKVVIAGSLVTGQNPASASAVGAALVKLLGEKK